jgi:hypothetical protein
MFSYVLKSVAADVIDRELAGDLTGIDDGNLGWLSLPSLSEAHRAEVERVVRDRLLAKAQRDLPPTMGNKAAAVDCIRSLVALVDR